MKNDRVEAVRDHSAARVMVGAFPRMPMAQDTRKDPRAKVLSMTSVSSGKEAPN